MGHECLRIKSRNYIVTSSLLSLQPFAKMKIISFSLEIIVQICIYLCTVWFSIIPSNQFFPFQSACLGQMKYLEETQAREQNF